MMITMIAMTTFLLGAVSGNVQKNCETDFDCAYLKQHYYCVETFKYCSCKLFFFVDKVNVTDDGCQPINCKDNTDCTLGTWDPSVKCNSQKCSCQKGFNLIEKETKCEAPIWESVVLWMAIILSICACTAGIFVCCFCCGKNSAQGKVSSSSIKGESVVKGQGSKT